MVDIFISYARRDGFPLAQRLTQDLRGAGLDVFWDHDSIPPTANWERTLDEALENTTHIVVIMTPFSVKSEEVEAEWRPMLSRKNVIPLLYQPCQIPRRLAMRQYVDFQGDYPLAFAQLLKTIQDYSPDVVFKDDLDDQQRWERAKSYAENGLNAEAVNDFILLLDAAASRHRLSATRWLGQLRDPNAIPALVKRLEQEPDAEVKTSILTSLERLTFHTMPNAEAWNQLENLVIHLGDSYDGVREMTAKILGNLKTVGFENLLTVLQQDSDAKVRRQAAVALGNMGRPAAQPYLVNALGDSHDEVQAAAAGALGLCGDEGALKPLQRLANQARDGFVRDMAMRSVEMIRGRLSTL